ncbi:MAG: GAF domain-containing sensor histidine kinase [Balneolaceae bacterium]|nr:GAF domain-containing sensor histidine kinase [Balneolaceae bacterium]
MSDNHQEPELDEIDTAPLPNDELERLLELSNLDLDYSKLQEDLRDLTKLAAHVAGTEISLVNLIDAHTQWTVANFGIDLDQIPREDSVCQYTILADSHLEVPNLKNDGRFSDKDYVLSKPKLEYYFGIPLTTENGRNIGALCVLDTAARELSPEKAELLKIIAREIVARLESIKTINELKENLEEISDLPRKLLHDIRGPIGGIVGLAEIIKDEAEEKNLGDILELVEIIDKGGRSVLDLANELLSSHAVRNEEELRGIENQRFTFLLLKEKLEQLYTPQASSKGVHFRVEVQGKNQKLPIPKHKLLQIIGNLASNAIKFTPEEGTVSVSMKLRETEMPETKPGPNEVQDELHTHQLSVVVKDNGTGMSPELVKHINNWEANPESVSTPGTAGEKGYGFGLKLVKHLVNSLEGTLEVLSEQGRGARIEVTIPVTP